MLCAMCLTKLKCKAQKNVKLRKEASSVGVGNQILPENAKSCYFLLQCWKSTFCYGFGMQKF